MCMSRHVFLTLGQLAKIHETFQKYLMFCIVHAFLNSNIENIYKQICINSITYYMYIRIQPLHKVTICINDTWMYYYS